MKFLKKVLHIKARKKEEEQYCCQIPRARIRYRYGANWNSCINNISLSVNINGPSKSSRHRLPAVIQTADRPAAVTQKERRKTRETSKKKHIQSSLEDVSLNKHSGLSGVDISNDQSFPLRRCQSLAVSREDSDDLYGNLKSLPSTDPGRPRRSQLIPRARLIDRTTGRPGNDKGYQFRNSYDNISSIKPKLASRTSSFPVDIDVIDSPSRYHNGNLEEELFYSLNHLTTDSHRESESLDSNFYNKSSSYSTCQLSHDNTPNKDFGLNLPNYYPNNSSDHSCLEDASVTEREEEFEDTADLANEKSSIENKTPKGQSPVLRRKLKSFTSIEDIVYDDNIHFGKSSAFDNKPRRFRDFIPSYQDGRDCFTGRPRSFPNEYLSYVIDIDIPEQRESSEKEKSTSDYNGYIELDKNIDEIDLNCDHISKGLNHRQQQTESQRTNSENSTYTDLPLVETNPIYDELPIQSCTVSEPKNSIKLPESNTNTFEQVNGSASSPVLTKLKNDSDSSVINLEKGEIGDKQTAKVCDPIKTRIKVEASDEVDNEAYKTIVQVDDKLENQSQNETPKATKEVHKTPRKPLQTFISRKLSSAFGDFNIRRENKHKHKSSLQQNQYHSLPDLSVGENLRKCEKIDRKLRKCEKLAIPKNPYSNDRFIVNIGPHFVVNQAPPVDFEVKITKVTKQNKSKKHRKQNQVNDQEQESFLKAVKQLNQTLSVNSSNPESDKPVPDIQTGKCTERDKRIQIDSGDKNNNERKPATKSKKRKHQKREIIERKLDKLKNEPLPQIAEAIELKDVEKTMKEIKRENSQTDTIDSMRNCSPELIEKVGTMRKHWKKLSNEPTQPEDEENVTETEPKSKFDEEIQTKVEDVIKKFEPKKERVVERQVSMVQATKQLFEPKVTPTKVEKISPLIKETLAVFEKPVTRKNRFSDSSNQFESLSPFSVDIIETRNEKKAESCSSGRISSCDSITSDYSRSQEDLSEKSLQTSPQKLKQTEDPEFDRVRFRVMKSELFQKNIFANCEKESQFEGLMQYLQDYSFHDMLTDNHIVIIEPIRTTVPFPNENSSTTKNVTPLLHKANFSKSQSGGLRHHFFYHPIRVNKEMNENELPNPDTVKQARQMFEKCLKKSRSYEELNNKTNLKKSLTDPDKDNCSIEDNCNTSDFGSTDELYDDLCCEYQYVSEDVLKKIRECGTSVTYYGGKVLDKGNEAFNPMTKVIMEEIRGLKKRECTCRRISIDRETLQKENNNRYAHSDRILLQRKQQQQQQQQRDKKENDKNEFTNQAFKLTLLKSNSCSSRLELIGTKIVQDNGSPSNYSSFSKVDFGLGETEEPLHILSVKDIINESIKRQDKSEKIDSPKIIAEKWKCPNDKLNKSNENLSCKSNPSTTTKFAEYHGFANKTNEALKKREDIEFEPYEIASSN
ncbi:protein javelin [Agrilus planipennis]|uniref:Protein javelin n=1 Tax=Agrilus planipennis TaxID=224129 RepID=A0A1W4W422_AGRPL|nr:protein javelin [Agrilus planipennis]